MVIFFKLIFLWILIIFSNSCSFVSSKLIHFSDIPSFDGTYEVGTKIFEWIDSTRFEHFTEQKDDFRKIKIQVWYPIRHTSIRKEPMPYIEFQEQIKAIGDALEIPSFLLTNIKSIKTNSYLDAPIIDKNQQFPLILYSHGLGGMRNQNLIQVESLVKQGYIVIAPNHTYDANITIFKNQIIANYRSDGQDIETEEDFWAFRLPQLKTRANDLIFIYNQIEILSKYSSFWSKIDIDNIGAFGHSFGGATCIMTSYLNNAIDAMFVLDPWMLPIPMEIIKLGPKIPLVYMGQNSWDNPKNLDNRDEYLRHGTAYKEKLIIDGAHHYDFTDTPIFSNLSKTLNVSGNIDTKQLNSNITMKIISFFNTYLKENQN